MKILILLGILILGVNTLDKDFVDKVMSELEEVGTQCAEKEAASADDITELMGNKYPPTSHTAKCMIACLYDHYKMMKDDGTFDTQVIIDTFKPLKEQDENVYGKVVEVVKICYEKPQIFDDRCETAAVMAACVKQQSLALGLDEDFI